MVKSIKKIVTVKYFPFYTSPVARRLIGFIDKPKSSSEKLIKINPLYYEHFNFKTKNLAKVSY